MVALTWANVVLAIVAMSCITTLLAIALFLHIDGTILATGIAVIAGLGGFIAASKLPTSQETKT